MNRKTVLLTLLVVFVGAGIRTVGAISAPEPEISLANWDGNTITQSPTVIILTPRGNETFSTNNVILKVNVGSQYWVINSVYYEADWQEGVHIIFTTQTTPTSMWNRVSITANFTEIPDGRHNITVHAKTHDGAHASSTIFFRTDASPPRITVSSIENKTYYTPELALNFTVNEPTSWVGYSFDGQENVSLAANTTLSGLTYGSHNLVVYANDTVGNMETTGNINFTIMELEAFPTALVIAAIVAAFVMSVSLLVYFEKRKRRTTDLSRNFDLGGACLVKKP